MYLFRPETYDLTPKNAGTELMVERQDGVKRKREGAYWTQLLSVSPDKPPTTRCSPDAYNRTRWRPKLSWQQSLRLCIQFS